MPGGAKRPRANPEKWGGFVDECILSMRGITKNFGATKALDDVDFSVRRGEAHALLGENGAGKSTLMKVFSGVYPADAGEIILDGKKVCFANTRMAVDGGVSLIFQELNLVPTLTTVENAFWAACGATEGASSTGRACRGSSPAS